jgi:hypothetical protein
LEKPHRKDEADEQKSHDACVRFIAEKLKCSARKKGTLRDILHEKCGKEYKFSFDVYKKITLKC